MLRSTCASTVVFADPYCGADLHEFKGNDSAESERAKMDYFVQLSEGLSFQFWIAAAVGLKAQSRPEVRRA